MQTPHAHPIKDHYVTTFFIAFFTLKMGFNNWRSLLTDSNSDWRLYNDANKHFRRRLFFFLTKYSTPKAALPFSSSIKKSMRIRANNFVVIGLLLVPLWKMKPPVDPNPWKMQDLSRPKLLSTVILRILILWYICFQWEKVENYSRLSCLMERTRVISAAN